MCSRRHDPPLLFVEVDPATSKITTEVRSHVTTLQHRRRQNEHNRQNTTKSGGVKRLAFRPLATDGDDGGAGGTYTDWITPQQETTPEPAIPLPSYHFVAIDPGKEPDMAVGHDLRAFLARQQHNERRGRIKLERSTSVDQLSNKPAIAPKGLKSIAITPTSQTSFDQPALKKKSVQGCRSPALLDEITAEQTASAPLLLRSLEDPNDQLNIYSRQLGTGVSTIWAYYLWQEREHGRLFHAQYTRFKGFGARFLHPMILTDPAVLATTVLFTGCLLRQRFGHDIMTPAILHMRYLSYRLVQGSIDQSPQPGDATILAVLKLALFEAMFGQRKAYQIHMQGLTRMLQLRNGLSGLGFDGYLAHLLIWFDANLSVITQTPPHLTGFVTAEESMQQANPNDASFALGVKLNAIIEG